MALPGMDLQSQYNQTLQNTIGQSQAERLRQTRQQQSIANTDWQQRGVGEDAKRMAGFQEVNPSEMPNMSSETRSFIEPLLGAYQEGGKQVEGYYGKDNPYTQGGLESLLGKQGYAHAPSSLSEQFKSVGLKLPNAYGQDYYNASHEDVGNKINAYQQQQQVQQVEEALQQQTIDNLYKNLKSSGEWQQWEPGKLSIQAFVNSGFIPGKNNGSWIWNPAHPVTILDENGFDTDQSDYNKYGGYWLNANGSNHGITYTPSVGFTESDYDSAPKGFAKFAPSLVMAGLGGIFGGAGGLIGGSIGQGVGSAIPAMIGTGASTGDWGKALESGGLAALGGGLGGAYGTDLGNALGLSGKLASGVGSGLISSAVNTAGNALLGNKVNAQNAIANTLASVASPYLGDLAKNTIGGSAGDIFGGAVGGFSGNALKNILQGKSLDINTALSTLSGATGGLSKLFSNTNEDKQSVDGPTQLAQTLRGIKNGSTTTSRRA